VLDYAKINNLTRDTSTKRKKKRTKKTKATINPNKGHNNDVLTVVSDIDVSTVLEDVLGTVFSGFHYQQALAQKLQQCSDKFELPSVAVVVDINKCDNYIFRTQPGAWQRIIMNLFGNALKYTETGFIKVKLQVLSSSLKDESELRLTVSDSGIGMSEDYVNNRLFTSFAQENPLSQGTGLGLSIVKQLVEHLGGTIEVRSEKGQGTKFIVSCHMKPSTMSPTVGKSTSEQALVDVKKRTTGMNVHFVGFDYEEDYFTVEHPKDKNATRLTQKALENQCVDWFGMRVWKHGTVNAPSPDLFVATESGARHLRAQYSHSPKKSLAVPTIVVCRGAASAQLTTAITVPGHTFECISQPCGPYKLAKALSSCFDRHANHTMVENNTAGKMVLSTRSSKMTQLALKENRTPTGSGAMSMPQQMGRPTIASTMSAPEVRSINNVPAKVAKESPHSLNCLAVDDNPINLRLLRTFINKLGHTHILARTGIEALEAYKASCARGQPPFSDTLPPVAPDTLYSSPSTAVQKKLSSNVDVILMDINMPEMDGLEATRHIRAHERDLGLSPVTIIALTGLASSEAQQEAHASGVNLFLIKPVRLAELEVVLKGVVTGKEDEGREHKKPAEVKEQESAPTLGELGEKKGELMVVVEEHEKGVESHSRSKSAVV
jgi:CheY-like chemotaxis protein